MTTAKEIWNNKDLRCGGFYELSIQVSDNQSGDPIKLLAKTIFEMDFVKGPFDDQFNKVELDLEYGNNLGYLVIEGKQLPFQTYFMLLEGDGEYHWLDISIHTAMLENVLGEEYKTWTLDAKWHKGLDDLLMDILKQLNHVFNIQMAMIGFEVSTMYGIDWLINNELQDHDISHTKFFVNKADIPKLNPGNSEKVNLL